MDRDRVIVVFGKARRMSASMLEGLSGGGKGRGGRMASRVRMGVVSGILGRLMQTAVEEQMVVEEKVEVEQVGVEEEVKEEARPAGSVKAEAEGGEEGKEEELQKVDAERRDDVDR